MASGVSAENRRIRGGIAVSEKSVKAGEKSIRSHTLQEFVFQQVRLATFGLFATVFGEFFFFTRKVVGISPTWCTVIPGALGSLSA